MIVEVLAKQGLLNGERYHKAGDVIELPDDRAKQLIKREAVKPTNKKPKSGKADSDKPESNKDKGDAK